MRKALLILSLFTAFFIAGGCDQEKPKELILMDFEHDSDLDKFRWRCHVLYSLSEAHATNGSRSLKMEMFPSEYPGLTLRPKTKNWRGYRFFSFDVFNPSEKIVELSVRIDDRDDDPDYDDRYNGSFYLLHGANRINIPLDSLITSRTERALNLSNISQVIIFIVKPKQKTVLFLDALALR